MPQEAVAPRFVGPAEQLRVGEQRRLARRDPEEPGQLAPVVEPSVDYETQLSIRVNDRLTVVLVLAYQPVSEMTDCRLSFAPRPRGRGGRDRQGPAHGSDVRSWHTIAREIDDPEDRAHTAASTNAASNSAIAESLVLHSFGRVNSKTGT
jgi:hypothetical protein